MTRFCQRMMITVGLLATFLLAGPAKAGPVWDWLCGCCGCGGCSGNDCPPGSYSCIHYWAPNLSRANDCLHGPHLDVYPPDRHPEIVPTITVLRYPCPPAHPEATIIPLPSAPESSKFQYLDRGTIGGSSSIPPNAGAASMEGNSSGSVKKKDPEGTGSEKKDDPKKKGGEEKPQTPKKLEIDPNVKPEPKDSPK